LLGASGVGFSLMSPDAVLDHMNEVKGSIAVLDADFQEAFARGRVPKNTVVAWESFKDEWRAFYATNQDWLPRFTGAGEIDDRTGVFANKVIAFRAILKAAGAAVSGPPPEPPPPPLLAQLGNAAGGSTGTYIKVGIAIVGLFAVGYVIKEVHGVLP
jgi:hypothetical protein